MSPAAAAAAVVCCRCGLLLLWSAALCDLQAGEAAPLIRGEGLHNDNYNLFLQQLDAVKASLDYFRTGQPASFVSAPGESSPPPLPSPRPGLRPSPPAKWVLWTGFDVLFCVLVVCVCFSS